MKRVFLSVLNLLLPAHGQDRVFVPTGATTNEREVHVLRELTSSGNVELTASNGFFDKGFFQATGKSAAPEVDTAFIPFHFEALRPTQPGGTARWYLRADQPRNIPIQLHGKGAWKIRLGDVTQTLQAGETATLTFSEKGQFVVEASPVDVDSRLEKLTYPAGLGAPDLLRARWRPAAVHCRYDSSTVNEPTIWVFESQSIGQGSNYSPMTTNFGYFGATFDADNRASGGVNFSMWAASKQDSALPPIRTMPHLLATGNPEAEFSGFGHEGSGVKIRGWEPFAHHPKEVIQALRMETDREFETYYGYLWDDRKDRWILFAAGRQPVRHGRPRTLSATSFCEVPGPPDVERTGDLVREIKRRGWFYGNDEQWHAVDLCEMTGKKGVVNKWIGKSEDGWLTMGMGGMEFFKSGEPVTIPLNQTLPHYLQPEKARQLFQLPVEFQSHSAKAEGRSASVKYRVKPLKSAKAQLFYGEVDCLTFAPRGLHGTEKKGTSAELFSRNRMWQQASAPQSFEGDSFHFELENLQPETTYFYRAIVTHEGGKSWDFESGSFTTGK